MSQSDYLKYKRLSVELRVDSSYNKMPPVFESHKYLDYKQYVLENTIVNTKTIYNRITPSGEQIVFNMNKKSTNCPSFLVCSNTQKRPNRVPLSQSYYVPTPLPLNVNQTKNAKNQKNACKCKLNSINTDRYICSCKLGAWSLQNI
jgi:hypothetical protein